MRTYLVVIAIASLILLGCYSMPIGGGEASLITTSKNFTMKEGGEQNFKIVVGESEQVHTITVGHIAEHAATIRIDSNTLILTPSTPASISLDGKTVFVTLDSISEGYAKFTIAISQEGGTPPQGQNGTQPNLKSNGASCASNSDCQSNHCSNGYCCASGSCCLSDSNCSVGKCNATTYSCFTTALLSNGAPCNSNSDCQSNHCSNGYCCASGKCCLSNSNCASGEVCNTTTSSCVSTGPTYTPLDAERKANSTTDGLLMARFSSIFDSARNCAGGSSAYKQCVPHVAVREDKISEPEYGVTYTYSFNGTSCCSNVDVLIINVTLSSNSTTAQWLDTTITPTSADTINASVISNCATAVQYIACKS
jgi:hypothetical protein